jgi:hypothetical protein
VFHENGEVGVEAHVPKLKAIGWAGRAKRKVKVVSLAKDGICQEAESVRQQKPNAKPGELPVYDVSPRWPAAADADVGKHRAAPYNQEAVVAINIPHLRSI